MYPYPIIPGSEVTYKGMPYIVRKLDEENPNCLYFDHASGGFFRLVHVSSVTFGFLTSEDDLCIWPDGTWCHRYELPEFTHKSDDYRIVSVFTPAYDVEYEALTCSPPAAQTVAHLPVPSTGQGVDFSCGSAPGVAQAKRAAPGAACASSLPHGNHGENIS